MQYTFTFDLRRRPVYGFLFDLESRKLYPLYFWAISVVEVTRYTAKYAELNGVSREKFLLRLLTSSIDGTKAYKYQGGELQNLISKEDIEALESSSITLDKLLTVVVETMQDTESFSSIEKYVDSLVRAVKVNQVYKNVDIFTKTFLKKGSTEAELSKLGLDRLSSSYAVMDIIYPLKDLSYFEPMYAEVGTSAIHSTDYRTVELVNIDTSKQEYRLVNKEDIKRIDWILRPQQTEFIASKVTRFSEDFLELSENLEARKDAYEEAESRVASDLSKYSIGYTEIASSNFASKFVSKQANIGSGTEGKNLRAVYGIELCLGDTDKNTASKGAESSTSNVAGKVLQVNGAEGSNSADSTKHTQHGVIVNFFQDLTKRFFKGVEPNDVHDIGSVISNKGSEFQPTTEAGNVLNDKGSEIMLRSETNPDEYFDGYIMELKATESTSSTEVGKQRQSGAELTQSTEVGQTDSNKSAELLYSDTGKKSHKGISIDSAKDVSVSSAKKGVEHGSSVDTLKHTAKTIVLSLLGKLGVYKPKNAEPTVTVDKQTSKAVEPLVEIDRDNPNYAEFSSSTEITTRERSNVEGDNLEMSTPKKATIVEGTVPLEAIVGYARKGIEQVANNTEVDNSSASHSLEMSNSKEAQSDGFFSVELVKDALRYRNRPPVEADNTLDISPTTSKAVDSSVKELSTSEKALVDSVISQVTKRDRSMVDSLIAEATQSDRSMVDSDIAEIGSSSQQYVEPVVEVGNKPVVAAEPVIEVGSNKEKLADTIVDTLKKEHKGTEQSVLISKEKEKGMEFYKRWRFKTGEANDLIWLNPEDSDILKLAKLREKISNKFLTDYKQILNDMHEGTTQQMYNEILDMLYNWKDHTMTEPDLVEIYHILHEQLFKAIDNMAINVYDNSISREQVYTMFSEIGDAVATEYRHNYIEPIINEHQYLCVEAKISFKAMLDFILFVEQLMHNSRFFYAASRATTAIDDIVKNLDSWLAESSPAPEVPKEYEYLVRWYKWWAGAERHKNINNMELNGLQSLQAIRDNMVNYFEIHWGKRVVEYGEDGMYQYSKDHSYIDKHKGRRHGNNARVVDRKNLKDFYGIGEEDLKYDIEREERL
jgi:hypothetical protein